MGTAMARAYRQPKKAAMNSRPGGSISRTGTAVALTCGLDGRGNGTRPHVEAAVRAELGIFRFSVGKKTERRRVGVAQGFFTDAVDDGDEGIISGLACRTGTLRRHVPSFSGWARAKGTPWARRTDRRKAPVMQTGSG